MPLFAVEVVIPVSVFAETAEEAEAAARRWAPISTGCGSLDTQQVVEVRNVEQAELHGFDVGRTCTVVVGQQENLPIRNLVEGTTQHDEEIRKQLEDIVREHFPSVVLHVPSPLEPYAYEVCMVPVNDVTACVTFMHREFMVAMKAKQLHAQYPTVRSEAQTLKWRPGVYVEATRRSTKK